jgi:hypothetical protein
MGKDRANGDIALLQPIQLPSGKIVDLSKCIAIVPSANEIDNEMILAGTEQQIQIDAADLEVLQQELKQRKIDDRFPQKLGDDDRVEMMQKLERFNARWHEMATDENAEREADKLKQIIDAERPSRQKLYSAE